MSFLWCRRRDLNPHGFPHTPLKRARIPIPSRRHISIIVFSCQISFSLCDGSCFMETTLSKNDTQSFFSAECHVDISRLMYSVVKFRFSLCDGSCFLETTLSKNDTLCYFLVARFKRVCGYLLHKLHLCRK